MYIIKAYMLLKAFVFISYMLFASICSSAFSLYNNRYTVKEVL